MGEWSQIVTKGGSRRLLIFILIGIAVISIEAGVSYIVNINNNKAPVNDVSPIDIKTHFEQRFCGQSVASIEDYVREFKIPGFCSLPLGIVMDRDDNV
jgi:hypothetical protein